MGRTALGRPLERTPRCAQVVRLRTRAALRPPLQLFYEVSGLYATHKRYVRSIDREQLAGGARSAGELDR
jgi:hypothetical protein